jgi:hypothetical protein
MARYKLTGYTVNTDELPDWKIDELTKSTTIVTAENKEHARRVLRDEYVDEFHDVEIEEVN